MDVGTVIVIVAAIGAGSSLKMARIHAGTDRWGRRMRGGFGPQPGSALPDPAQPSPREAELERELAELKDRLHVLERIATDGRHSRALADEIESLRER